jgi:hypothetical protein
VWKLVTLAIVWSIGGCGKRADDAPTPVARPPAPRSDAAAAALPDAALAAPPDAAIDLTGSPEQLWNSYRAVIATATPRNFAETGRKLWPLLAKQSHDQVRRVTSELIARSRTKVSIPTDELGFRLLGDSAWSHAPDLREAELQHVFPESNGARVELNIYRPGVPNLHFVAEQEGSSWLLDPGPWLVSAKSLDTVLREPEREAPTGSTSVEQVAERWKDVNEKGTGWDAYNMLSPAQRGRVPPELGEDIVGELVAALHKTLVDRRARGIHVDKVAVERVTGDRATFMVTYSNQQTEQFVAIRAEGLWWLELPI